MTDKQPALFDWATELSDAQVHVTLSEQEAHEIGARLRSMGDKLKAYEDLDEAASDVQLLRMGYAAARLEIESLQARIKTMAEEHADELMVAHLDGRMRGRSTEPAGEYPAAPEGVAFFVEYGGDVFTLDQMRAYADATCAMRAAQPASGLDPELGPMLDFANAGEIAFYDYAVAQHCRATLDILDGKDNGAGACNEPWASVRKRLLSIVELHQSSSASHGQAPAQAAPAAVAGTSEFPHEQMDAVALDRYKVVPSHESMFHRHAVVAGDGSQQLYIGREAECQNMARKFAGAFLDGAFAFHSMLAAAPTPPAKAADSVLEDAARLDWLLLHISGAEFRRIGVHYSGNASRADVDAARKQGANHD